MRLATGLVAAVALLASYGAATPPAAPPGSGQTQPSDGPSSGGHYSIDVANKGGAHVPGPGHHEGDGDVHCSRTPDGVWSAGAVYFATDAVDPGKDVGAFTITTTPEHDWLQMTLMHHSTDSPFDWSVMAGPNYSPTFSFTVNDKAKPITITAVADDDHAHINIVATCSQVDDALPSGG